MTRPRSLADELAELVNPAPQGELDPEAGGIPEGDALGGSDDELAGLVGLAAAGRRAIAADIALEGGEYQGRRSSRAALFGDEQQQQQQVSSSGEGQDSGSDDDDGAQQLGGVRVARHVQGALPPGRHDLSTIPTMFVNGHMNGPGRDDPTSSSSLFSDEGEEEEGEQQQQQQQQQVDALVEPAQQQAAAAADVQQQQPARGQAQQQQVEGGSGSCEDDEGSSEQEEEQQLGQEAAEGSSSEQGDSEGGSQEEHDGADAATADSEDGGSAGSEDQAGSDGASGDGDGDVHIMGANGLDVDAAAAGVAAMLGDDEEMQQLEREAAAAQAEAAQQLVAASARSSRDAEKATGVRAQQRLWGAALELRIRLQKALAGGNCLPRPHARAALAAASPQVAASYSELLGSCQATLQDMLSLHQTLAQQHPAAAAALAAAEATQQQQQQQPGKSKRSRAMAGIDADGEQQQQQQQQPVSVQYAGSCRTADEAWCAVDGAIASLAGFRDASLDKWHRRTVLSSGTAALRGSSGLRALQQSVSSQVAALMADKAKLVARSQLPVELAPRPLGCPAAAAADGQAVGSDDDEAEPGGRAGAAGRRDRARDAETYDEGDFYQQLLKELLDSASPGSLPQQLAGARPPKRRKLVDRRASKGRKIRYHTMDKLVGFMAPAELVPPPFAEQLFGNLFSHQG